MHPWPRWIELMEGMVQVMGFDYFEVSPTRVWVSGTPKLFMLLVLRTGLISSGLYPGGIWMPEYKEEGGFLFKAVEETHPP
ncbi:hypothetical protein OROGR_023032 [Orobanche gracilis]